MDLKKKISWSFWHTSWKPCVEIPGPELIYLQDGGWHTGAVEVPLGTAEEDSPMFSVSLVLFWKRKAAGLRFWGGCLPLHLLGIHCLERGGRSACGICCVELKSPHSLISGLLKRLSTSLTSNQGVPVTQKPKEKKKAKPYFHLDSLNSSLKKMPWNCHPLSVCLIK